mgnify:FL=1
MLAALSFDLEPQFKLEYIFFDFPPILLKNPCLINLILDNFFDVISLKTCFKFIFFTFYKHHLK